VKEKKGQRGKEGVKEGINKRKGYPERGKGGGKNISWSQIHLWLRPCLLLFCIAVHHEETQLNPAGNSQHNRPWFLLITDFASNTTLHGIRYLVEPTRFMIRR